MTSNLYEKQYSHGTSREQYVTSTLYENKRNKPSFATKVYGFISFQCGTYCAQEKSKKINPNIRWKQPIFIYRLPPPVYTVAVTVALSLRSPISGCMPWNIWRACKTLLLGIFLTRGLAYPLFYS